MEQSRARPHRSRPGPPTKRVLITDRDRLLLEMAAEHRLILPAHVGALLGVSGSAASSRLRALSRGAYLAPQRLFAGQPTAYQITRRGLEVIDSPLPRPRMDARAYAHDSGLTWLWLAARGGTFGELRQVLSERTMRSRDGKLAGRSAADGLAPANEPLGIRLGGVGPRGRERLHYPDLMLITPQGGRIAVELELSGKGRTRREKILAGYGADARVDAVLYLVENQSVARSIQSSARRLGISSLVHVQRVRHPSASPVGQGRSAQRSPPTRGAGLLSPAPTGGREP